MSQTHQNVLVGDGDCRYKVVSAVNRHGVSVEFARVKVPRSATDPRWVQDLVRLVEGRARAWELRERQEWVKAAWPLVEFSGVVAAAEQKEPSEAELQVLSGPRNGDQ